MYVIILSNDAFIIIGNFEITNTRLLVLELVGCTLFNNILDSHTLCLNSSNFMTNRIKIFLLWYGYIGHSKNSVFHSILNSNNRGP